MNPQSIPQSIQNTSQSPVIVSVYSQGDPGSGIGGYDLLSSADRGFAFDYESSGKLDHLVFYRPGSGIIYILKHEGNGSFSAVYPNQANPGGSGIGGYNLLSSADRGFAFDYESSGKLDHLVFYRPGRGAIFIVKSNGDGTFTTPYAQGDPGNGIGGYNLLSPSDQGFAFDYESSGKLDHLVFYRPGRGAIFILQNITQEYSILSQMQGQTITQGWDVICAMQTERINELFAQRYANQVHEGSSLPAINGIVPILDGYAVELVNLVLGPPLISFLPNSNDATLQINFIAGMVNTLGPDNNTILASQSISPSDEYQLTGTVPLSSVEGAIENGNDIILDIKNGTNFVANLNVKNASKTALGQYFLTFLQTNASNFKYVLGTLVCDAAGTNLTPVMFDLATQVDRTNPGDSGRLLLFIATTYNPQGGKQTSLSIANIIPDGYATTLLVSSQVLFSNIFVSYLRQQFPGSDAITANQSQPDSPYSVNVTTQSQNLGSFRFSDGWDGTIYSANAITIPQTTAQLSCNGQYALALNLDQQWTDQWYHDYSVIAAGNEINYHNSVSVTNHVSVHSSFTPTVDSATCQICFNLNQPPQSVFQAIDQDGDNITNSCDAYSSSVSQTIKTTFNPFNQIQPPDIDTFAVSNLLFPEQHILNFQQVYLPGDLAIFGDIFTAELATSPVSAIVAAGQTQQFIATANNQPIEISWSIQPSGRGSISATGLYTAPSCVAKSQLVLVTATLSESQVRNSVLMLVPEGVLVAPAAAIFQDGTAQQFSAAIAGDGEQAMTWSINPAGVGTIASDDTTFVGTYTPPASVQSPTAVTITAANRANPAIHGTALAIVLTGLTTEAMVISPPHVSLQPNQTQQFAVENKSGKQLNPDKWWVFSTASSAGSINNGNYIAPEGIANSEIVVVVATLQDDVTENTLVATALVYLEPPNASTFQLP